MDTWAAWVLAFGLMLVIEGTLYALFPGPLRRGISIMLALSETQMRVFGVISVVVGLGVAWLVMG